MAKEKLSHPIFEGSTIHGQAERPPIPEQREDETESQKNARLFATYVDAANRPLRDNYVAAPWAGVYNLEGEVNPANRLTANARESEEPMLGTTLKNNSVERPEGLETVVNSNERRVSLKSNFQGGLS